MKETWREHFKDNGDGTYTVMPVGFAKLEVIYLKGEKAHSDHARLVEWINSWLNEQEKPDWW